jgi:toxin ParE1/3/4
MTRIVLAPAAEADLKMIHDYIAAENAVAAAALVTRLKDLAVLLADAPGIGRARPELLANLRSFPLGSYLLCYRPSDNGIEVVRVLHGARDIPGLFGAAHD